MVDADQRVAFVEFTNPKSGESFRLTDIPEGRSKQALGGERGPWCLSAVALAGPAGTTTTSLEYALCFPGSAADEGRGPAGIRVADGEVRLLSGSESQ